MRDNPRFGLNNWHLSWDQEQEDYYFGKNLTPAMRALLVNEQQRGGARGGRASD